MKKNTAIKFIFPNSYNGNLIYHLGVNYIIAYLRLKGIYSEQLVTKDYLGTKAMADLILQGSPMAVGFTCFNANYYLIKILARELKKKCPDILIIAGGPTATFSDNELLTDIPELDICVRREGEYTVYDIIDCLNKGKDIGGVTGISYRKDKKVIRNQTRPLIIDNQNRFAELDVIPSPYLTGVLKPEDILEHNGDIPVLTSRGCVYKCSYCNFSAMSKHTIRYHSIDRIMSELEVIGRLRESHREFRVGIQDDTFTSNKRRVYELCSRINEKGLDLEFWAETRGDLLDSKMIDALYRAGMRRIDIGLESSVPKVLYAMKKVRKDYGRKNGFLQERRYVEKTKKNIRYAKKKGMSVGVNLIFGFPGETLKDGLKTLKFISGLGLDRYNHNLLHIFPGTELFDRISSDENGPIRKKFLQRYFFAYLYSEYDLKRLPVLDFNFDLSLHEAISSVFLNKTLTGMTGKNRSSYPESIILTGENIPYNWCERNLAWQTKIIFGEGISSFFKNKNKGNIRLAAESFTEILPFVSKKGNRSLFIGFRQNKLRHSNNYLLSKIELLGKLSKKAMAARTVFSISDDEDVWELLRQAGLGKDVNPRRSNSTLLSNCMILDGCRWSDNCPGFLMKRFIISDKGKIRPCFQGDIIGDTGIALSTIKKKLFSLRKKIESQRGCSHCMAKDRCSRCMFLGAISPDMYCDIIRKYPAIKRFINFLSITREAQCSINMRRRII